MVQNSVSSRRQPKHWIQRLLLGFRRRLRSMLDRGNYDVYRNKLHAKHDGTRIHQFIRGTYTIVKSITEPKRQPYTNPNSDSNSYTYSDANCHTNTNAHPNANGDSYTYTYTYPISCSYSNTNSNT